MNMKAWTARFLIAVAPALSGAPALAQAQSGAPAQQQTQTAEPNGGMVDPSRGPLSPVPSSPLPNAPSSTQPSAKQTPSSGTAQQQQGTIEEPVGAAVGKAGVTSGGPASRPAGNAIAPAKQHQTRSLLIKLAVIGAAGVAIGTVLALSKASPSNPPGAR
ncbi:MAG: hypothetical protein ACE14M_08865 [Terriglobales bacterium]